MDMRLLACNCDRFALTTSAGTPIALPALVSIASNLEAVPIP